MLVSYSIYKLIIEEFGVTTKDIKYFCGHSLGEYSALVSIGSLKFEDAIFLLHEEESQCKKLYRKEKEQCLQFWDLRWMK